MTPRPVLVVDLRDAAGHADGPQLPPDGGARVLVIDDVATLTDHESMFDKLESSELVHGIVCVAAGAPAGRGAATVLRSSAVLDSDRVATLWVGDPEGVGWELGRTGVLPPQTVPAPVGPAFRTLLDVLRIPEVFDRVVQLAADLPGHAASPGLLLVAAGTVRRRELMAAEAGAARLAVGAVKRPAGGPPDAFGDLAAALLDRLDGWVPEAAVRRVDALHQAAAQACVRAADGVQRLAGPVGPPITASQDAWARAAAAGRAVGELRFAAADLVRRAGGDGGPDLVQHEPQTERCAVTARLRDAVQDALGRGRPLDALAATLRDAAARLAPAGSAAHLAQLSEHCPDSVVDGLARPSAFPFRVLRPWVLVAVAACGALAGLAGWVAGVLLAVAWVLTAGVAVARCPTGPGGHRPTPADTTGLRIHAGIAAAAVVAGVLAGTALTVPAPLRVALTALAAVGLALVLRTWWYGALWSWLASLNIYRARAAAELVHRLLQDVALTDRPAADTRRFAADAATAVADAVDAAAETLTRHVTHLPDGEPPPSDGEPASSNGVAAPAPLVDVITRDLLDAVGAALRPCWERLLAGDVGRAPDGVPERLAELLRDYRLHLELYGPGERPAFANGPPDRTALTRPLLRNSTSVGRLIGRSHADGLMVQLCSAADLALLDPAAAATRLIRFAPLAMGSGDATGQAERDAGRLTEEDDVVWTSPDRLAGVLRLVPLRDGAVALARPTVEGGRR